jgi:hypothetical protein
MTKWAYDVFQTTPGQLKEDLNIHGAGGWELVNTHHSLFKVLCVIKKPLDEYDASMKIKSNDDFTKMREMYEKD